MTKTEKAKRIIVWSLMKRENNNQDKTLGFNDVKSLFYGKGFKFDEVHEAVDQLIKEGILVGHSDFVDIPPVEESQSLITFGKFNEDNMNNIGLYYDGSNPYHIGFNEPKNKKYKIVLSKTIYKEFYSRQSKDLMFAEAYELYLDDVIRIKNGCKWLDIGELEITSEKEVPDNGDYVPEYGYDIEDCDLTYMAHVSCRKKVSRTVYAEAPNVFYIESFLRNRLGRFDNEFIPYNAYDSVDQPKYASWDRTDAFSSSIAISKCNIDSIDVVDEIPDGYLWRKNCFLNTCDGWTSHLKYNKDHYKGE